MDVATISANGQITVPVEVRRELQVGPGDKIAFVKNEYGDVTVVRTSAAALLAAQRAFSGAAAAASLESEEQVDALVADVRSERRGRRGR